MITFHPSLTVEQVQRFLGPGWKLRWVPQSITASNK
jgi:hypothetical protein